MTEEVSRHLLEVLRLFEKAQDKKSWSDISFATSALRDVMEEVPNRKPLPWEQYISIYLWTFTFIIKEISEKGYYSIGT